MRPTALAFAILIALPATSNAQEYVFANGKMSDDDFYRAVACAAIPGGGECRKPMVKWDRQGPIRIAVRTMDDAYLGGKRIRGFAALERAIQEINGAEAGVRLVKVAEGADAEVEIFFLDLERGEAITGTGIEGVDGAMLGGATTRVLYDRDTGAILRVAIMYSTTLQIRAYESVMLEELAQSMGLMTDIKNTFYDDISVFSQETNASTALGEQDKMALRRHYGK